MAIGWYLLPGGGPFYGTIPAGVDEISEPAGFALHRQHVYKPAAWGSHWNKAKLEAATRLVKVHIFGDSIYAKGTGSSAPRTTSVAGRIQTAVQAAYGNGGSGYLSHEYATLTGTWTSPVDLYMGAGSRTASAAASMQWTGIVGTTVRIFHRNTQHSGTLRWRIDGGAWTNVTPPTGFGTEPGLIEATGLADVPHTVDVEWVSGVVAVMGVQGFRATGVIVDRLGHSGRAASDFGPVILERLPSVGKTNGSANITTPAPGGFRSWHVGKYIVGTGIPDDTTIQSVSSATAAVMSANASDAATVTADIQINRSRWAGAAAGITDPGFAVGLGRADLVIFALGVNDPANLDYSAATFRDGASRILNPYTSGNVYNFTPEMVFVVPHFANWFDNLSTKGSIAREAAAMAEGVGGALVDVWGIGKRSYKFWNDAAYFADNVHPNDAGHQQHANAILNNLLLAA